MTQPFRAGATPPGASFILGHATGSSDNNFNLIRVLMAVAVLVFHAWPITGGAETVEPLKSGIGYSLGSLAVFVFFILSGFFIAASFSRSRSVTDFVVARAARLLPGLAISLIFVALFLGPIVSSLGLVDYLGHPETGLFLLRNLTMVKPQYSLPGVFDTLPYPTIEGSIWTLFYEVVCYGLALVLGLAGALFNRRVMVGFLGTYALVWCAPLFISPTLHPMLGHLRTLSLPFLIGVAFWLWRDQIVLSAPMCVVLILAAVVTQGTPLEFPMLCLTLSYCTFWLGHRPRGPVRRFNRLGDYSYGIYIYAFPLQGLAIWLWGPMGPALNIALSLPLTVLCAVLSWHLVERPARDLARAGRGKVRHPSPQY